VPLDAGTSTGSLLWRIAADAIAKVVTQMSEVLQWKPPVPCPQDPTFLVGFRLPLSPIYTHRLYLWAALDVGTSRDVVLHFGPTIFIKITCDSILGANLY
jgi:hypothetical protein